MATLEWTSLLPCKQYKRQCLSQLQLSLTQLTVIWEKSLHWKTAKIPLACNPCLGRGSWLLLDVLTTNGTDAGQVVLRGIGKWVEHHIVSNPARFLWLLPLSLYLVFLCWLLSMMYSNSKLKQTFSSTMFHWPECFITATKNQPKRKVKCLI